MPTTVFLCRWHGGWSEVSSPTGVATFGRIEAMLSLGAQHSLPEVIRIASAELSTTFAKDREQMTVRHRPASLAETPYSGGYIPSDTVEAEDFSGDPTNFDVVSLTVTEDDETGQLDFTPIIGDLIPGIEELQEQMRDSHRPPRLVPDKMADLLPFPHLDPPR